MTAAEFWGSMAIAVAAFFVAMFIDNLVVRGLCIYVAMMASNYAGWMGNRLK